MIRSNLRTIQSFVKDNAKELDKKSVVINLNSYTHLPIIHGIEIGERIIYMSFSGWTKFGIISDPAVNSKYLKISVTDDGEFPNECVKHFHSWLNMAKNIYPVKE